jgi:hypothetical protein
MVLDRSSDMQKLILSLLALLALTGCDSDKITGRDGQGEVVTAVASDDASLYVRFAAMTRAAGEVRYRPRGERAWTTVPLSLEADRVRLDQLTNGRTYEVQVTLGDQVGPIALGTPRPRPECAFDDRTFGLPLMYVACSSQGIAHLTELLPDAHGARCVDGHVVGPPADTWDCMLLLLGRRHFTILRTADSIAPFQPFVEIDLIRTVARRQIWGQNDPFRAGFASIQPQILPLPDALPTSLPISSARTLVFQLHPLFASRVVHLEPQGPARATVIYLQGHDGSWTGPGLSNVEGLLRRHFRVLAIDMPLYGLNYADIWDDRWNHNDLQHLKGDRPTLISFFMDPVKGAVDHAAASWPDSPILALGHSGGGMTAYVYGAVDPRVEYVVSLSGGTPLGRRMKSPAGVAEISDLEQFDPHLYGITGHELLMGAAGSKGGFFSYNTLDDCCYRVSPADEFVSYLRDAGKVSGRSVTVHVDPTFPGHAPSPATWSAIYAELDRMYPTR